MTPERGRLVALEGVDGSGKSTQAKILAESLGAVLTFEPGATQLGRALRRLLLDPDRPVLDVRSEALLMAADRAQHVAQVIRPALDAGQLVVTDRFSGSTLAYQGCGRGLPVGELRQLVDWASGGVEADLTILVDVPISVARRRLEEME
ncbi:MAG TPA: dTMP kinase, partial [Acidimicrobiales bacterium]|nr:dTMP kinase [Acidimicrobiales bacterium]